MRTIPNANIAWFSAFFVATSTCLAQAQNVDFQVGNFSLEQANTAVVQNASNPNFLVQGNPASDVGSSAVILQSGVDNQAATNITGNDSGAAILQAGENNQSLIVIDNSPGSVAGSVQVGSDNFAGIGIVGGQNNTVGVAQIGNNLGAVVGLVDSSGTTVTYGQAGQDYNGGIVIKNAPPGTTVKIN